MQWAELFNCDKLSFEEKKLIRVFGKVSGSVRQLKIRWKKIMLAE